jgi:Fur family transcriptional regulator, ferric uptake regulator
MTKEQEMFITTLKDSDKSVTKTRSLVFAALLEKEPQSMGELYQSLKNKLDRASLYRTIDLFERLGIVQRLQIGWKYKIELSDTYNYHHHHITCSRCAMTIPVREDLTLEASIKSLAMEYGFTGISHQLEIRGICQNCQKS